MKKRQRLICILLCLCLLAASACGGGREATGTPAVYIDLSAENSPVIEENNVGRTVVSSSGVGSVSGVTLLFDGNEETYGLSSVGISGMHDSYGCGDCSYEEKNGFTAFHLCDHHGGHSGVRVDLKVPIAASLVSDISMTFMTGSEINNVSQVRILKKDETNASNIINHGNCPDISGAVDDWKTVSFGMSRSNIASLADEDGYIRSFKFYFRDKDDTDIYIKSFSFDVSVEALCTLTSISENSFYRGNAVDIIARTIAANLTAAGISAEIELRTGGYVANTTAENGKINYRVTLNTPDGESLFLPSAKVVIKKIEGAWLELSDGVYGAVRDSKEQYKTSFGADGTLLLEDNILKAAEKLVTVEYAVIERDGDVTDPAVQWFAPHLLELSEDGFSRLYINAALDYGTLTDGGEYRLAVRGVTENENYILHLDVPFTYKASSSKAAKALRAAKAVADGAELRCDFGETDKAEYIKSELKRLINNENIVISVETSADGMLSGRYSAAFRYASGSFAYNGTLYTSSLNVTYREQLSEIVLLSPYDGESGLRIASDETVRYWNTDQDLLAGGIYQFASGEVCDPSPVRLEWSDGGAADEYTVSISEEPELSNALSYTVSQCFADVYNLKAGQRYYWKVSREGCESAVFTFVTESGYPRYILSDGVSNFRDIGGYTTLDGKTVRQGLAFRCSNFDSLSESDVMLIGGELGVKTELDLRGQIESSLLGSDTNVYPISIKWYGGIFAEGEDEPIRQAVSVFADADNYPIGYHCAIGRDRTGTVTVLILGLLGVDRETVAKEYLMSMNSVSGSGDGVSALDLMANLESLMAGLDTFGDADDSFSEKVEKYLLSIGVTAEQISSIRGILLED